MKRTLLALGGYALFVVAVFLVVGTRLDLQEAERRAADAATHRAIWQSRYAEAVTQQETVTVRVTRWATRYDTIRAAMDSVITDTVTTVPAYWVRALIVASDSTVAACRELVSSCEQLRRAADSSLTYTQNERDAYKQMAKRSRWEKMRPWVFGAVGFYIGAKLRVK